jgi:hypothetical protein
MAFKVDAKFEVYDCYQTIAHIREPCKPSFDVIDLNTKVTPSMVCHPKLLHLGF